MIQLIERVHELLRNELPRDSFKEYYIGFPDNPVEVMMPYIATEIVSSEHVLGPTQMDGDNFSIEMRIVFPKIRGIGTGHHKGERSEIRNFYRLILGYDFSGSYAVRESDCIIEILRSHMFLKGSTTNTSGTEIIYNFDGSVDFLPSDPESRYIEARLTFTAQLFVDVTSRI